ncbi:MAG: hypothetical protein ACK4TI_02205 [Nitrososphaerales archaeon]
MSGEQKPYTAFILTLAAGTLIFANGLVFGLSIQGLTEALEYVMTTRGVAGSVVLALGRFMFALSVVGLVLGALTIFASLMLYYRPAGSSGWGAAILVLSILSIFVGGGFLLGLILGVIGGSLALAWSPKNT